MKFKLNFGWITIEGYQDRIVIWRNYLKGKLRKKKLCTVDKNDKLCKNKVMKTNKKIK